MIGVGTTQAEEAKTSNYLGYFTVKGGFDKYHDFEDGLAVMGSGGSYVTDNLRTEVEVSYRSSSASGSASTVLGPTTGEVTLRNIGAMVNLLYELDLHPTLRPYVLGGVGGSLYLWEVDVQTRSVRGSADGSEFAFSYQGGGGVRYVINTAWALDVEYRFFGTPDVGLEGLPGVEVTNEHSSFLVGLSRRY